MPHAPPKHRPAGWRPAVKGTDPFYSSTYWKKLRAVIRRRDGGICRLCQAPGSYLVDHILPRSEGGGENPANLRLLCSACDNRRHREKGMR